MIAAGVRPDSVAQFKFFRGGQEVSYFQTRWANNNCVINQEYVPIWLAPDTYQVYAVFEEPTVARSHRAAGCAAAAPATDRPTAVRVVPIAQLNTTTATLFTDPVGERRWPALPDLSPDWY